ncbi:serine/threonine protein kinase-like protein [Phanerochaete sordida]|uniref:Serine/threonine protein kinase-like protein n=1 Tax=Phanerochaete sordida TaxID=48140 RepID=A0A9P3G310_9APHY|nr:serine/threonine protein kinase-like protein [Phanerochaete sordida]
MTLSTFITHPYAVNAVNAASGVASLSPIPGVSVVPSLIQQIQQIVKEAKNNQEACQTLAEKCSNYGEMFAKHYHEIQGTAMHAPVKDAERLLREAAEKLQVYSNWGFWRTLFNGDKMQADLKASAATLDSAMADFSVTGTIRNYTEVRTMNVNVSAQLAELQDGVSELLQRRGSASTEDDIIFAQKAKQLLATADDSRLEIAGMQVNQTQFNVIVKEITKTLKQVQGRTGVEHNLTVLEDKVTLRSTIPIPSESHYTEVYQGYYQFTQLVAVRCFRNKTDSEKAVKRFKRETERWSQLHHKHVQPLIGIMYVTISKDLTNAALVSPWQEGGNIRQFIQEHVTHNRYYLLAGAASGLDYLHSQGMSHGNIRGTNVLITAEGEAVISDFHMSKIMSDLTKDSSAMHTVTRDTSPRWSAPELMMGQNKTPNPKSDVWSFGMVILEVLTDEFPYASCKNPNQVPIMLIQRKMPPRPQQNHWVTDPVWRLMEDCWRMDTEIALRPDMATVRDRLAEAADDYATRPPPIPQEI